MHLATGAVVNAVWDLLAKQAGKPVWRLVAEMTPEEIADIVDFRYLTDVLTRDEALEILHNGRGRQDGAHRHRSKRKAIPATRHRPAGSAMATRSCAASARRRSMPASTISR